MTEYIKNQLIKLCDNPEWFNDMLNTWDFKPERESQAIKEYLSHVLLNGKLENTHIERIELQGRMVSAFIFDISMYGHYIACKCLDISSEEEYMNQYTDIRILTNELEPC